MRKTGVLATLLLLVNTAGRADDAIKLADVLGLWATQQGQKVRIAGSGQAIQFLGKLKWDPGKYDPVKFSLHFEHSPEVKEMDGEIPVEVRPDAKKGHLKTEIDLTAKRVDGRLVLEGFWYKGKVNWEKDVDAKTKAVTYRYLGVEKGPPFPLRYSRADLNPSAKWAEQEGQPGNKLSIEGISKPIAGFAYTKNSTTLSLLIEDNGADLSGAIESVEIRNLISKERPALIFSKELLHISYDRSNSRTLVAFDADELLKAMQSGVNRNVLEARVRLRDQPLTPLVTAASVNVAHVLRQKLLIFIPGVIASTIWVKPEADHPEFEAYPKFSLGWLPESLGTQYSKYLEFDSAGEPTPQSRATTLNLFRGFGLLPTDGSSLTSFAPLSRLGYWFKSDALIYDIDDKRSRTDPEGHPKLSINNQPVEYYPLSIWPYDWRRRVEDNVSLLTSDGARPSTEPVDPPFHMLRGASFEKGTYVPPPSIHQILVEKKKANPFLDDKAALVGHSLGGLVTRGVLAQAGMSSFVDKAFFVDSPLFGAPKAYYVFLTGIMGVPFLSDDQMRSLAPDLPCLYYLAPTARYAEKAAEASAVYFPSLVEAGHIMAQLTKEARNRNLYPQAGKGVREWNAGLEASARRWHSGIDGNVGAVGWEKCVVFYSKQPAASSGTVGVVRIGRNAVEFDPIEGDGTVPLYSQIGEFKDHPETEKLEIPSSPKHQSAANEEFVWKEVVTRLFR